MADEKVAWPTLTDKSGEELGEDVILDDDNFLAVRAVENPTNGFRYSQVRLWTKQEDGTWKRSFRDVGLTLDADLNRLYAKVMDSGDLGTALSDLQSVLDAGTKPGSGGKASSGPKVKDKAKVEPAAAGPRRY